MLEVKFQPFPPEANVDSAGADNPVLKSPSKLPPPATIALSARAKRITNYNFITHAKLCASVWFEGGRRATDLLPCPAR